MRLESSSPAMKFVARFLGSRVRKVVSARLVRYSPAFRYIAVALWFYRFLKKRSQSGTARLTLKPGDSVQISSTLKK